ncbi:MAG: hypothetical protein RLZZ408_974 [Verrucomicrobiota bacterium]|jgi:hypothetical protein
MSTPTPISLEKCTRLRLQLVSASEEEGFPSPAGDQLERHIEVGEDQELTISGALTYIIHQAR